MSRRKKIPAKVTTKLFIDSAGYCQNPSCLCELFPEEMGGLKHIAERAHIIPYGNGPRIEQTPTDAFDVNSVDNLILLCPTCHTIIDKNEAPYPRELLLGWKSTHLTQLSVRQGIIEYQTREEVREVIEVLMSENKAIWESYAPSGGRFFDYDPESTTAKTWDKRMRSVIIPNHFKIQNIIRLNSRHLQSNERVTFSEYQEHIKILVERHISKISGGVVRYPQEMGSMFL